VTSRIDPRRAARRPGKRGIFRRLRENLRHPGPEAWALRLLGEIAARREPVDVEAADAAFRQAMTLAHRLEMRPLMAHCHLGLGRLYRRAGRPDTAREELEAGLALFRRSAGRKARSRWRRGNYAAPATASATRASPCGPNAAPTPKSDASAPIWS
jgi:hypothetical protein